MVKDSAVCRRCGRGLKNPDSVSEGIGPKCKKKEEAEAGRICRQA